MDSSVLILNNMNDRITYLDSFRAIMIIMVVALHAMGRVHLSPETQSLVRFMVGTIPVAAFFLVDGFLFSFRQCSLSSFEYTPYILKSAQRLLIPWVAFNIIYFLFRILFEYISVRSGNQGLLNENIIIGKSFGERIVAVYTSQIAGQMYFLMSLFIIRFFSFITIQLLFTNSLLVILVFLLYVITWNYIDFESFFLPGLDPVLHAIWGFQYYLLGIILYFYNKQIYKYSLQITIVSFTILIILKFLIKPSYVFVQYSFLIAAYTFFRYNKYNNFLEKIGKNTMGIYILHYPLIISAVASLFLFIPINNQILLYILMVACIFLISLFTTKQIIKFPYGRYLFGDFKR